MALEKNLLGLVPITILHGTLEVCSMVAIQVLKDPVLVLETPICPLLRSTVLNSGEIPLLRAGC